MLIKASFQELGRGDRDKSLSLLLLHTALHTAAAVSEPVRDLATNRKVHAELNARAAYEFRKLVMKTEDQTPPGTDPERRPKQINGNFRPIGVHKEVGESADPTRPIPMVGPGGKHVWRWDASGEVGFEAESLHAILRGGDKNRRRIPIDTYYPDGRTTTAGCYHRGSHVWDRLVAKWRLSDFRDYRYPAHEEATYALLKGEKLFDPRQMEKTPSAEWRAKDIYGNTVDYILTGFAGMMEQPYTLIGAKELGIRKRRPMVDEYNYTRSRHGFSISMENGRETWRSRGSLSHNRPKATLHPRREGEWLNENHQHGYGGRPLMDDEGYVLMHDGTPWMVFERITEMNEFRCEKGLRHTLPWKTEVVARRMKTPFEFFRKGEITWHGKDGSEEVLIATVDNDNGVPFPATDRHGLGYLFEGFNLFEKPIEIGGERYWIGTGSPGNYVEDYGVVLGFRREADGPIGRYTLATCEEGDLDNCARGFAENYGLTWTGRADIFFDEKAQPWAILHAVDYDNLPPGFPKTGWPPAHQFDYYFRNQFVVPIEFVIKNGMPTIQFVDPFVSSHPEQPRVPTRKKQRT